MFEKDLNGGLVAQVIEEHKRQRIFRQTRTYTSQTIVALATAASLSGPAEAESILSQMVRSFVRLFPGCMGRSLARSLPSHGGFRALMNLPCPRRFLFKVWEFISALFLSHPQLFYPTPSIALPPQISSGALAAKIDGPRGVVRFESASAGSAFSAPADASREAAAVEAREIERALELEAAMKVRGKRPPVLLACSPPEPVLFLPRSSICRSFAQPVCCDSNSCRVLLLQNIVHLAAKVRAVDFELKTAPPSKGGSASSSSSSSSSASAALGSRNA